MNKKDTDLEIQLLLREVEDEPIYSDELEGMIMDRLPEQSNYADLLRNSLQKLRVFTAVSVMLFLAYLVSVVFSIQESLLLGHEDEALQMVGGILGILFLGLIGLSISKPGVLSKAG